MTVSGFTLLSRILGLLRDMVIAHHLGGRSVGADAWNAAFQFPNFFRRVFGEGAFNAAFVPMYSGKLEGEESEAFRFANRVIILLAFILAGVFALCFFFIGPIMWFVNMGYDADTLELTISLARITTGYLFFVCLLAAFSGILNSHKKFAAPAMSYAFLNIIFLGALLGVMPFIDVDAEYVLSWSLLVAGLVQFSIVFVSAWRMGFRFRPRLPKIDSDMKRLGLLMIPGLVSAGVQQLNLLVGGMIASFQPGAKSVMYYADRINQLPLGLIGIAFGVVLLPDISRKVKANDMEQARGSLQMGLTMAMLLALPAMIGMTVLAEPIFEAFFKSGEFTSQDSTVIGHALMAFAIGCPAYIMVRVVQPGYFAREDTKTPMRFTFISAFVNIVLCGVAWLTMRDSGNLHIGCAAATTIAGWLNVFLLINGLKKDGFMKLERAFWMKMFKMLIASVVMGVVVYFAADLLKETLYEGMKLVKIMVLLLIASTGVVSYFLAVHIIGAVSLTEIKQGFRR